MEYSKDEILQFMYEEDVKFIRLAFCDVFGKRKNISIMPEELPRAFQNGIAFDASAIAGYGNIAHSDLFLRPLPDTLTSLPWRPEHGRVMRMISDITYSDGTPFMCDPRQILKKAVEKADELGYSFYFGAEQEFYLFKIDENGIATKIPCDKAGYMDIAPEDKGENVRRDVCLTLEQMGVRPESSHHEEGCGQNEIDFRYADALTAADQAIIFQTVVTTVANRNGYHADFSAKPLEDEPGNGFHINLSVKSKKDDDVFEAVIAGILDKSIDMTVFLNPSEASYRRLGKNKAPGYVSWSHENRSQLVRIPAAFGEYRRIELRSPDPSANPYIAFALMIYAALDGIEKGLVPPEAADFDLFTADPETLSKYKKLPRSLKDARAAAENSEFIHKYLPQEIIDVYCAE